MKRIFTYFLILNAVGATAQAPASSPAPSSPGQCTIAFYSRDSIAIQLPEAKPHYASMAQSEKTIDDIRVRMIIANDHWLTVKDDSALSATPAGRKKQQDALQQLLDLQADSLIEELSIKQELEKLKPVHAKVDRVADSIGRKQNVKQVREHNDNSPMICPPDQMLMHDITNDIAIAMNVKPKLARVGIYNRDSLLRTMPGYAVRADSSLLDMRKLDSAVAIMDKEIKVKQQELDSLRASLSKSKITKREKEIADLQDNRDTYYYWEKYSMELRQADRTRAYTDKLDAALAASVKETNCRYYYSQNLNVPWTEKEAEFVDLNGSIAQKIKSGQGK